MDTFLFFEPHGRRWTPRRDISSHEPLNFWDPWSAFSELDGPVWRPCAHVPGVPAHQCLREPQQQQVEKAEPEKNDGFKLSLDAAGYKPEEVSVKLSDGVVTVRARHHEKTSGGLVTSSMVRRVRLPEDVDASALRSRLTREGQLVLEAPPAGAPEAVEAPEQPAVEAPAAEDKMQVAEPVEKPQFQVSVDVSAFKPEEVSVKVDGGVVTVDAHREQTSEEGCSSMRMVRKFALPRNVNPDLLKSRLTTAGQLMVEAPEAAKNGGEGAMETA